MSSSPTPLSAERPVHRWYGALLAPYLHTVEAACKRLPVSVDAAVPRTGLAGALIAHIARSWGRRRWQETGRLAIAAAEALNQRAWRGAPRPQTRERWLGADVQRMKSAWDRLRRRDEALVQRVLARVADVPSDLADHEVPEGVIFLRGAVLAGVLVGDVPDAFHRRLDHWATWMGLAWEAEQGSLSEARWHGALYAVGLAAPFRPGDALEQARTALGRLPDRALLDLSPAPEAGTRPVRAWIPRAAPLSLQRPSPPGLEAALEQTLGVVASSESRCLSRALRFLQQQGGKRLRPKLVLSAAKACGGDPADALLVASLIEWLHLTSLILDDIVDEGRLRRGLPALHVATDIPFALGLSGWILSRLYQAALPLPDSLRHPLLDTATALASGQHDELRHTRDASLDLTGYYRIIEGKTARLFACAARLGGAAVGADNETLSTLAEIGRELGLAFQIVDDVLDYLGEEQTLGKSPGTDWQAGKITLPLLLVSDRSGPLETLVQRMRVEGIGEACLSRARMHRDRALTAIATLPHPEGRAELEQIVSRCVERQR